MRYRYYNDIIFKLSTTFRNRFKKALKNNSKNSDTIKLIGVDSLRCSMITRLLDPVIFRLCARRHEKVKGSFKDSLGIVRKINPAIPACPSRAHHPGWTSLGVPRQRARRSCSPVLRMLKTCAPGRLPPHATASIRRFCTPSRRRNRGSEPGRCIRTKMAARTSGSRKSTASGCPT